MMSPNFWAPSRCGTTNDGICHYFQGGSYCLVADQALYLLLQHWYFGTVSCQLVGDSLFEFIHDFIDICHVNYEFSLVLAQSVCETLKVGFNAFFQGVCFHWYINKTFKSRFKWLNIWRTLTSISIWSLWWQNGIILINKGITCGRLHNVVYLCLVFSENNIIY